MDFHQWITEFLGIQDVTIEDIEFSKKEMKAKITARQNREQCFCCHCGLQFDGVKEWVKKNIEVPPMGIFSNIEFEFYQLRGLCSDCDPGAQTVSSPWFNHSQEKRRFKPNFGRSCASRHFFQMAWERNIFLFFKIRETKI